RASRLRPLPCLRRAVSAGTPVARPGDPVEPAYSRQQALRTPTFWLLSLYTAAVYPVQAGVSLHQAPHLLERGLSPAVAATIVSTFSFTSALAGPRLFPFFPPVRRPAPPRVG